MTPGPRRILVSFRLVESLREVLDGISSYTRTSHCDWRIQCVDADEFERSLRGHAPDGVITVLTPRTGALIARLRRSGVPTVNMLHDVHAQIPSVLSDDYQIGRIGAKYLLARGFVNVAYMGIATEWSARRQRGFVETLRRGGRRCHVCAERFRVSEYRSLDTGRPKLRLAGWIASLPRPVGILACSDPVGRALLAACETNAVKVPDEVAILGVDNLVVTCELASVPLSSIAQDFPRLGFEAARMLDRLMSGRKAPRKPVIVPPGGIAVRRSTDVFAFEDPIVATAMRIIHHRGAEGLGIKELVSKLDISRKWLDVRFKAVVGHTASHEIRQMRLRCIRDLLVTTDLPIRQIAHRCGFGCGENLIRFFRDAQGVPPQEFRTRNR